MPLTVNAQPVTPSVPTASVSSQPTCSTATGTITVTAPATGVGITYTVTGTSPVVAGVTNATGVFAGLTAGNYDVTTSANGCTSSALPLTVNAQPVTPSVPTASSNSPVCEGSSLNLTSSSSTIGGAYSWTGPNGFISYSQNPTVSSNATLPMAGTYSVTITLGSCTSLPATTIVIVDSLAVASFSADPLTGVLPFTVNFTNTSQTANSYVWNFGDGTATNLTTSPSYIYNTSGTYIVTLDATFNSHCSSSAQATIVVFDHYSIIIPNVFTPNGDGYNDVFKVTSTGVEEFEGAVFDRWGLKQFEWTKINQSWDGHANNGMPSIEGTYYYYFKIKGYDKKDYSAQGYIQLIR